MSLKGDKLKLIHDVCLRVYTSKVKLPKEYTIIPQHDLYFRDVTKQRITSKDFKLMQMFSKVKEYDESTGRIVTPYGETDLEHLCTGCKAILNLVHILPSEKVAFNLIELDDSMAQMVLEFIEKHSLDVPVYVSTNYWESLMFEEPIKYLWNGEKLMEKEW